MISKDLAKFIDDIDVKLDEKYNCNSDNEKKVLLQMMKVNEELGELCNEILASHGCQREDKLNNHSKEVLEGEAIDVLFAFLLLLKKLDINIDSAVSKKMEEIKERFEVK